MRHFAAAITFVLVLLASSLAQAGAPGRVFLAAFEGEGYTEGVAEVYVADGKAVLIYSAKLTSSRPGAGTQLALTSEKVSGHVVGLVHDSKVSKGALRVGIIDDAARIEIKTLAAVGTSGKTTGTLKLRKPGGNWASFPLSMVGFETTAQTKGGVPTKVYVGNAVNDAGKSAGTVVVVEDRNGSAARYAVTAASGAQEARTVGAKGNTSARPLGSGRFEPPAGKLITIASERFRCDEVLSKAHFKGRKVGDKIQIYETYYKSFVGLSGAAPR